MFTKLCLFVNLWIRWLCFGGGRGRVWSCLVNVSVGVCWFQGAGAGGRVFGKCVFVCMCVCERERMIVLVTSASHCQTNESGISQVSLCNDSGTADIISCNRNENGFGSGSKNAVVVVLMMIELVRNEDDDDDNDNDNNDGTINET